MTFLYTHLPQNEDIGPEGRSYNLTEFLLDFKNRKVLYLYVSASDISFCDRNYAAHLAAVNVKGYVNRWKYTINEKGETLSEVDPITEEQDRREIAEMLRTNHKVPTVNFI